MINPMYNILLGSAKTSTKLWIQHSSQPYDLAVIQRAVDALVTLSGIGRLPRKVESGFSTFSKQSSGKIGSSFFQLSALNLY